MKLYPSFQFISHIQKKNYNAIKKNDGNYFMEDREEEKIIG